MAKRHVCVEPLYLYGAVIGNGQVGHRDVTLFLGVDPSGELVPLEGEADPHVALAGLDLLAVKHERHVVEQRVGRVVVLGVGRYVVERADVGVEALIALGYRLHHELRLVRDGFGVHHVGRDVDLLVVVGVARALGLGILGFLVRNDLGFLFGLVRVCVGLLGLLVVRRLLALVDGHLWLLLLPRLGSGFGALFGQLLITLLFFLFLFRLGFGLALLHNRRHVVRDNRLRDLVPRFCDALRRQQAHHQHDGAKHRQQPL